MFRHLPASILLAGSLSALPFNLSANIATESDDSAPLGPIVVTATRTRESVHDIASSVTVITRKDIEDSGKVRVAELLRDVPGLTLIQSGGPGQQSSVFMRGTESNHVLVLIDDIEISDPSVPGAQMDFANLTVENVERIEIVRGPQSTLYGSDAIGGVIHIITRRDDSSSYHLEIGELATVNTGAAFRRHVGIHQISLSANVLDTAGSSASTPSATNFDEHDAYRNITASLRWGVQLSDTLRFDISTRLQQAESEIDLFGATAVAHDPDATQDTDQLFSRLSLHWDDPNGRWSQRVSFSDSDHERRNDNGPGGANPFPSSTTFTGSKRKLDWQHTHKFGGAQTVVLGAEVERDRIRSNVLAESVQTSAIYLQDHIRFAAGTSVTLGLRHDKHDNFGGETTWKVAPRTTLSATGTVLKASYGTGFKAPSLTELYQSFPFIDGFGNNFSFFANPDLEPERSKGWDVGFEQAFFSNRIELGVTYFRNDIRDLVSSRPLGSCDFSNPPADCSSIAANVDEAETRGYEVVMDYRPNAVFNLYSAYTRTETEDLTTGQALLRRPENEYTLGFNWRALPAMRLSITGHHVGRREDFVGFSRGNLQSYRLIDLSAAYTLTPQWDLTARIDNLSDEEYEETSGYAGAPRTAYLGVRWQSR